MVFRAALVHNDPATIEKEEFCSTSYVTENLNSVEWVSCCHEVGYRVHIYWQALFWEMEDVPKELQLVTLNKVDKRLAVGHVIYDSVWDIIFSFFV